MLSMRIRILHSRLDTIKHVWDEGVGSVIVMPFTM